MYLSTLSVKIMGKWKGGDFIQTQGKSYTVVEKLQHFFYTYAMKCYKKTVLISFFMSAYPSACKNLKAIE
jgi:hypothetical protein